LHRNEELKIKNEKWMWAVAELISSMIKEVEVQVEKG